MTQHLFQLVVRIALINLLLCISYTFSVAQNRVLVFSKTGGFRHASIGPGKAAIQKLGVENGFSVDTTEDATLFNEKNLRRYVAVIFLNTTGDVLNPLQQNAFERYIQAGGGYLGVHAATDTEYDWPWYGKLAGAYFKDHPSTPSNVQPGEYHVHDKTHASTSFLPDPWKRTDEFYSFKDMNPDVKVLLTIDEKTYIGGTMGDWHPSAWYHEYDGGRAFYTSLGHTDETLLGTAFPAPPARRFALGDECQTRLQQSANATDAGGKPIHEGGFKRKTQRTDGTDHLPRRTGAVHRTTW